MSKKTINKHMWTKTIKRALLLATHSLLLALAILLVLALAYQTIYQNRIFPGTKIAGVDFGGLSRDEALTRLASMPQPDSLVFTSNDKQINVASTSLGLKYDSARTISNAFLVGREINPLTAIDSRLKNLVFGSNLALFYSMNDNSPNQVIESISGQFSAPAIIPSITVKNGAIVINPGKTGKYVDKEALRNSIQNSLSFAQKAPISVPINTASRQLSTDDIETAQKRAEKLLGKRLKIAFENQSFEYSDQELVSLVDLVTLQGYNQEGVSSLALEIAKKANRPPSNARFEFENGKVKEFNPAQTGIEVKQVQLSQNITEGVRNLETTDKQEETFQLPTSTTNPEVKNEDVNTLGIKELVGHGESTFRGSIASRVHNIVVATNKLDGLMIKPGEEFSFNQFLGDVSTFTGYQQAYVIKDGKTVLGDGGGVCQVSTTFFRAALNTGLPITERHHHSYRVSYYEQGTKPGIDATVYSPYADLKFKNDTSATILILAKVDTKNSRLTVDLYGTKDGRTVSISTPRVWDSQPPPPDLYQDDPTLPVGKVKQVEHAIGGIKASFQYKVERDGQVLQNRTFYSNYRPWQAVYLRGTGPTQ